MKSEAKFSADKKELRSYIKAKRKSIENKVEKDILIAQNLLSLDEIKKADTVLCYISLDDEICTDEIVSALLDLGKRVGAPYCVDNNGNMDFYYITDFDDLKIQSFGVREPVIEKCKKVTSFDNTIIILPGLCFDSNGNRLGYGKGYYDRFLKTTNAYKIGLIHRDLVVENVYSREWDISVDKLIEY